MRRLVATGGPVLLAALIAGCGDGATDPDRLGWDVVAGDYALSTLTFDPQGTLPSADVLTRIEPENRPTLTLTEQGGAQLVYVDPETGLTRTVEGSFATTATEVEVLFGSDQAYRDFLLSRTMSFTFSAAEDSLEFRDEAPEGVPRDRLLELVPEWEGEQLLQPTPGTLHVVFTRG